MSDIPTDVMTNGIIEILMQLEADANRQGWNYAPSLCCMQRGGPEPFEVANRSGQLMLISLQQLPVPHDTWALAGHPLGVLELVKSFFVQGHTIPDLLGMVLMNEAWTVWTDVDDVAGTDQATAAAQDHILDRHPDRQECRIVNCVDVAGQVYAVMRTRGDDDVVVAHDSTDGELIDALKELVELATPEPT